MISANAEVAQWEATQDGRQRQSRWMVTARLQLMVTVAMGNNSSAMGNRTVNQYNGQQDGGERLPPIKKWHNERQCKMDGSGNLSGWQLRDCNGWRQQQWATTAAQ